MAGAPQNRGFKAIPDQSGRLEAAVIPPAPIARPTPQAVDDENFDYLLSIAQRVRRRNAATSDGSLIQDLGRSTLKNLAAVGSSFGFVAEQAGIPGGKAVREAGENAIQHWQDGLSEQFKDSQNKKFLSDEEGVIFDAGATDPRKIIDLVVSNLPFMLVGGGLGAGATKVLLGRAAARAAGANATKAQIAAAARALTRGQVATAGIVGAGLGEGLVAAPLNAQQAFDEAMQVPYSTMAQTQAFKDAYKALPTDMPAEERLQKARTAVAKTAAAWVGIMTGGSTFALGAPSGVWLARLMNSAKGKNVFSTMAKGFVLEGPGQELPQTLAEELATGAAINVLADPDRKLMGDDLAEHLVGATLAGGITGATIGAASASGDDDAAAPPDPAAATAKDESTEAHLRQVMGIPDPNEEGESPQLDVGDAMTIQGEAQDATEANLPVGAVARKTSPDGEVFTGRVVARATQDMSAEETQAAGLDLDFEDAEGNQVDSVPAPGAVLRRDEETRFVADGEQVQVLDEDEAVEFQTRRDMDRKESQIVNKIPKQFEQLREQVPAYLKKYPDGANVDETDKDVIALQKTIEDITKIVGPERSREIVGDLISGLTKEAPGKPLKVVKNEAKGISEAQGEQTVKQLKKRRGELNKKAKELSATAAKTSPLGLLAAAKSASAGTAGINKSAAEAEGIDTTGRLNVGGRTVFTKDGMSLDAAAELLNESGQFGTGITANDVVDIIEDQLAGRPNKFSGDSAGIAEAAAVAEGELTILDVQIRAAKSKKAADFEDVRETRKGVEAAFGGRSIQTIEEDLRADAKLGKMFSEDEYFDTIANNETFRTLTDLMALAEAHDGAAVDELLGLSMTDLELAQGLLEIIDDEQNSFTESEEATGQDEGEAAVSEGPADAAEPVETTAKPGGATEPEQVAEPEPTPDPEVEVSDEQVAQTLKFIAGPFEEPPKGVVEVEVNTKLSNDVVRSAIAKLVKAGTIVKQDGIDVDRWSIAKPKGVRNPSQSAVNKAVKSVTDTILNNDKLVARLVGHAEDADTTDIRVTVDPHINTALKAAYGDAWSASEYFTAWSIAKIAKMRFNQAAELDSTAFPDQLYNSLVSQALKRQKLAQKSVDERARNLAISKRVGQSLKQLHRKLSAKGEIKDANFKAIAQKFIKGFRAAVDGKPRSLLSGDISEQNGFVSGREWGQTSEGAAFQRGKKGKKKEGVGPRLQRIHDNLGEQEWTEADKMLRDIYRMTNRSKLFDVDPEEIKKNTSSEPTGGARRALDKVRSQYATMAEVLVRGFGRFSGGAPNKKVAEIAKEAQDNGPEAFKEFQDKVKEIAEVYINKASDIARVFEANSNISGLLVGMDALAFKEPGSNELNEWGSEVWDKRLLLSHPRWVLRTYIKRQERNESDPYVTKERIKPLRWKRVENVVVTNSDRDGKDVTAKEFAKRFGVAGVTFGNWGTSKERTNHLNWMWDSFNDIADAMGIKPSQVGEGKTLHLAIGALGRGGKHSAHYSPNHPVDPDNPALGTARVINVTNKNGDGSVGHEWFHSLDFALDNRTSSASMGSYQKELVTMMRTLPREDITPESFMATFLNTYFGRLDVNDEGDLVRDRNTSTTPGVLWNAPAKTKLEGAIKHWLSSNNPENRDNAFNNQVSFYKEFVALTRSNYFNESRKLDNYQTDAYWSSPVELIARAGESFLGDKLLAKEAENNYLVNNDFSGDSAVGTHTGHKGNPYPAGDERKAINSLYDQWVKDITWGDGMPTIGDSVKTPIEAFTQPLYKVLENFLKDFDANVETLEAEARTKAEKIKKDLLAEKEARADEISELIEQTLESTDDSTVNEDVGIEELDDDAIDQMLADANASITEGDQETSDVTIQSADEQLGEEGPTGDGGQAGSGLDADNSPDGAGVAGPGAEPGEGSARSPANGGRAGRSGRGRGAAESESGVDTAGVGEDELAGAGRKSAKPGKRSKGRTHKRLTKDENLKAAKAAAKKAAQSGVEGLSNALTGLGELFGGAGKVNSFPAFDEKTYQAAKPHFIDSYNKFVQAGKSLAEWFRYMLNYFNVTFGLDVTPMLKRFAQEARDGKIDLERRAAATEGELTETVQREADDELTDSVFDEFQQTFKTPEITIPENWQTDYHPGKLVQAAAMASVPLPEVAYKHHLPRDMTSKGRVSPAQVEQVILAGESFTNILEDGTRRGFFIGDGTGVGKGREIAAIIIDQALAGKGSKKAVWFSENWKLFDDATRDYAGILGKSARVVTGKSVDMPLFQAKGLPTLKGQGDGILFQTYTTGRQTKKSKDPLTGVEISTFHKIDQMVEWLGDDFDGVIAFDESHAMGNSVARQDREPSAAGKAMRELRGRLPNARVLFVSATGATELDNMGYLERLGLWGSDTAFTDVFEFIEELKRGGKNVMEMIAHTMKAKGIYNARQLSWDGVRHEELVHTMTEGEIEQWNSMSDMIKEVKKDLAQAAELVGIKEIDRNFKTGQFVNLTKSQPEGRGQDIMLMMLTGLKAKTTVKSVLKDIRDGHAVLVQLTQTGDAATSRMVKDEDIQAELEREGKMFKLSPRELLQDFVMRKFPDTIHEPRLKPVKGKKAKMWAFPTDEPHVSAAALKTALLEKIKLLETPENGIDAVIKGLAKAGVAVSEVTGRVKNTNTRKANIDKFMDDEKQVLIFSGAGSTGATYNASLEAKNQRKRIHYILQAGWRADKVLQGMGRSHRSNQRVGAEPLYKLTTTDYGPEKRFTATIMRRLEQLGSLSSGERRAAGQGLFSAEHNIDGTYTFAALKKTLDDMVWLSTELREKGFPSLSEFARTTGLDVAGVNGVKEGGIPDLEKFLNRLLLSRIQFGTAVFDQFVANLTGMVDAAVAEGSFNEGIETVVADGIELVSTEQIRNTDGLKTEWVKVRLETKVDILTWNDHISEIREQENFSDIRVMQRRGSPQVFTVRPLPRVAGQVSNQFEFVGPYPQREGKKLTNAKRIVLSEHQIFQYNELEDGGKPDFRAVAEIWKGEEETWPGGKFQEQNYLVGDILGVWDRLSFIQDVKLHRLKTDDGKVLIGRFIPPTKVEKARENLQAELATAEIDLKVIFKLLMEGASVRLINNDEIKLRSISDEEGAERRLIINPKGVKRDGSRIDRIESIYTRFGVVQGQEVNSGLAGFGMINSNAVFEKVVGRFPIAGIEGITDEQTEALAGDDVKTDPDIWLEELTAEEVVDLKRRSLTFVTDAFPKQKLFRVEGKKGKTFEHKERIKRVGAVWVNKLKRWIIGEELIDRAKSELTELLSAGQSTGVRGMTVEAVTDVVQRIKSGWDGGGPDIVVVNSIKEVEGLQVDLKSLREGDVIAGLYQPTSGKIWLIANELHSAQHVATSIVHEMFHAGIGAMRVQGGVDVDAFLNRTFATFRTHPIMRNVLDMYTVHDPKTSAGRSKLAEEFIAKLTETEKGRESMTPKERGFIKRLVEFLKSLLRNIPLLRDYVATVSDSELLAFTMKSFKIGMDYTGPTAGERAESMFSVTRPKLLYGVNEAGDVKMAAVPNADGSYTVYTTDGSNLDNTSQLKKERVGSKKEALRRMANRALSPVLKTKRFGPKPSSSEIHVNYTIPDETRWDRMVATMQDRFKRLNVTQTAFTEQGASIDPDIDTYRAEERLHSLVFERIRKFEDTLVEPLEKAVAEAGKRFGITVNDVDDYLYAKHAPEANARLETINPEAVDKEQLSGRSNEWAAETLAEFERRGLTDPLEGIAKQIYNINNKRLEILEREGLASKRAVKAMRESYDFYVPLRGKSDRKAEIDGEDASGLSTGKGLSASGRERFRFGRHSVAKDLLTHSVLMMEETLIKVEKNRVGKTFLKFVQKFPNRDMWDVNSKQRKPRWDKDLGEVVYEARSYPPETMIVWVDGKEHQIFIKDPLLRRAMLGLNVVQVNSIVQAIAKVTRFLAAVNTSFNPEFALSNLIRDLGTAMVNLQDSELLRKHGLDNEAGVTKLAGNVLKGLSPALRGAWHGLRGTKLDEKTSASVKEWVNWFDDFRANGGKIEFFSMNSVENKRKELTKRLKRMQQGKIPVFDQLVWLKDWVSDMNGAIENGVRLSTYKNLVEQGVDRRVAASVARNLTVNFNRKGEIGNFMNAMFMFFNAGIQGTTRLFIAAKNPRIQKILFSITAGSFLLAEMARWVGGEDEDGENNYDKVPDWVKEHNLILMKADGSGGYYKIPLPYGYNIMNVLGVSMNKIFHIAQDDGAKELANQMPAEAVRIVMATMNAFNPIGGDGGLLQMASPTVLDPFVQIAANENFYGAPIRPEQPTYLQYEKPQSELYWSSGTTVSRDIAQWLNRVTGGNKFKPGWIDHSPEDMDHIFAFMFGGAGAFVLRSGDWVYAVANDESVPVRSIPLVRRFVAGSPEFVVPGKYRENVSELLQITSSLKEARRSGDSTGARSIAGENKDIIRLAGFMNSSQSRLRKLRARRRKIQDSKLPEAVKRKRVDVINEQIDSIQKQFNKRFKEARKAS